jgi:shikimate dehydrogenase
VKAAAADGRRLLMPGAGTRLVALLGDPVAHSVSPQLHGAAFAACGLDLTYLAFGVPAARLADAVAGLGALGALGANITVPHKVAALALADVVGEEAAAVGAANTLTWTAGGLRADNTDAPGLERVLREHADLRGGEAVVLLGAGGAARGAAVALGRLGAAVSVHARRPEAAADIAALVEKAGGAVTDTDPAGARVVINATSLGLHGESLPEAFHALRPDQVALDLVYGRAPTPFLRDAAAAGATAVDGRPLLVAQAALSFERWTGVAAPLSVMTAAVDAALG